MSSFRVRHYLLTALWVVPVLCVLAGVGLSLLTTWVDDGDLVSVTFSGGPDAALAILGGIAASMITLTGLVLTIVLVVVQLAMGQFSPRIVRTILRDRPSQLAIGIFAATFAHAVLAMREIGSTEPGEPVPGLAIVVAFLLVLVSITVLIAYVHHVGLTLRVASLVESIGNETRDVLDGAYGPAQPHPGAVRGRVVFAERSGNLFHLDTDRLVAAAAEGGCTLEVLVAVGDFVPAGSAIVKVREDENTPIDGRRSANPKLDEQAIRRALSLGPERTMNMDAAYGFRMLVDIALRCLSDTNDDPTTAVAALDRLHDCLRQLANRPFPDGLHRDQAGVVRLQVPTLSWEGYVRLAFDEIRDSAVRGGSAQTIRRMADALADLSAVTPEDRREPLRRQQELLLQGAGDDPDSVTRGSVVPDRQGIGSARDMREFPTLL